MNCYYKCPSCSHEHLIELTTVKGDIADIDDIPKECHNCGESFNQDKIEADIYACCENGGEYNSRQPDNRSEDK